MDIDRCRALIYAIDTGSLFAAAGKLNITTSGISKMMSTFEHEIGFELLYRNRGGVIPTKKCLDILPSIRQLVEQNEKCDKLVETISEQPQGRIKIGCAHHAYLSWLGDITKEFQKVYSKIEIELIHDYSSNLLKSVENHEIDACIISKREGNHKWIPLYKDKLVAWVSENHKLAKKNSISIEQLKKELFIATHVGEDTDYARIFKKYHIVPNTRLATKDVFVTYTMVEAGLRISVEHSLTAKVWQGKVKSLPIDFPTDIEIGLAYLENENEGLEKVNH